MESQYTDIESHDGIRLPYNIFPTFKESLPICIFHTPSTLSVSLDYTPVTCNSCKAIINPFCEVIHASWTCIFCNKKNNLPAHCQNNNVLPVEMVETSISYSLGNLNEYYVLLVDISTFDNERHQLTVDAVREILANFEKEKIVLVLFGTNIEIVMGRTRYLFSGKNEYTREMLTNLFTKNTGKSKSEMLSNLFVPADELHFDEKVLRRDPFPVMSGMRPLRCTGSALSFAASLLPGNAGKIFLVTQGPCTYGPGSIASLSLKDSIRSHSDLIKGRAVFVAHARLFYEKLGERLNMNSHTVDIIAATIEDIGVYEMLPVIDKTGGTVIMAQDFSREIYISSIQKLMANYAIGGKVRVHNSPNTTFKGILGQGMKQENEWRVGGILPNTTLTLLFESNNAKEDELGYIQIIVQSQTKGKVISRVTTLARAYASKPEKVTAGFDQEAASVLQARMFTSQSNLEEDIDLVRRIDRSLIRFMRKFATYKNNDPQSVTLSQTIHFFPQFTYFLRRSNVIHSEANSPDETIFYRHILLREKVTEALTIIVPVLTSYHYLNGTSPVDMDIRSLQSDTILLLDAFCYVLVWHGEHIHSWVNDKLHLEEGYEALKDCVESAEAHATQIVKSRSPTPVFVKTYAGGSQERILKCRINPARNEQAMVTDDIDFETFYSFLCKIVVEG